MSLLDKLTVSTSSTQKISAEIDILQRKMFLSKFQRVVRKNGSICSRKIFCNVIFIQVKMSLLYN